MSDKSPYKEAGVDANATRPAKRKPERTNIPSIREIARIGRGSVKKLALCRDCPRHPCRNSVYWRCNGIPVLKRKRKI